jgi:hypothetical protein
MAVRGRRNKSAEIWFPLEPAPQRDTRPPIAIGHMAAFLFDDEYVTIHWLDDDGRGREEWGCVQAVQRDEVGDDQRLYAMLCDHQCGRDFRYDIPLDSITAVFDSEGEQIV